MSPPTTSCECLTWLASDPRRYREPTVAEVLADPMIRLVMDADGVDPDELGSSLRQTADTLARREVPSRRQLCC